MNNRTEQQRTRQNYNKPTNKGKNIQTKPKVDFKNPDPNATKGCLSFALAFWIRSAIFSLAIYLAIRFLGLIGGNDMILKRESVTGPVTFSSQEYEITDSDLEAFTALINENQLTEEQKQYIYNLGK